MDPDSGAATASPAPHPLFDWLIGDGQAESREVRDALLLTLRETPSLMVIGFFWTQVGGIAAALTTHALWAYLWIAADIALLALRAAIRRRHITACAARQRAPHGAVIASYLVWFASIGLGALGCLLTSEMTMAVLGTVLILGYIGFTASRFAAIPRLAVLVMYFLALMLTIGLLYSEIPGLWMIGPLMPGAAVAFHILMRRNHAILVEALRAQQESRRLSMHDPLTGLPNRILLRETLNDLVRHPPRSGERGQFAVLCVDLDGFKEINDRYGHNVGDWVLKTVAARLQHSVRTHDIVCRIGGDEFVILLPAADRHAATEIAQRMISACVEPQDIGKAAPIEISASIGIALYPDHGSHPDRLIAHADSALYAVKRSGKNSWLVSGDRVVRPFTLVGGSEVSAGHHSEQRHLP